MTLALNAFPTHPVGPSRRAAPGLMRSGSTSWAGFVFFFTATPTTVIYTAQYTLSLHDALPIYICGRVHPPGHGAGHQRRLARGPAVVDADRKSTRLNSSRIEPSRMPSSA